MNTGNKRQIEVGPIALLHLWKWLLFFSFKDLRMHEARRTKGLYKY